MKKELFAAIIEYINEKVSYEIGSHESSYHNDYEFHPSHQGVEKAEKKLFELLENL